jgi:hypothetical protein
MKAKLFVLALVLASLACTQAVTTAVTPVVTQTLSPIPALTRTPKATLEARTESTVTISKPLVNVRAEPNGVVIGTLAAGDTVTVIECKANWCSIKEPAGYVWMGCLTGLNKNLGCEAR